MLNYLMLSYIIILSTFLVFIGCLFELFCTNIHNIFELILLVFIHSLFLCLELFCGSIHRYFQLIFGSRFFVPMS